MSDELRAKATAVCADCLVRLRFEVLPLLGEFVTCPECHTVLEVIQQNPLRLTWAYEEPIGDAFEELPRYGMEDGNHYGGDPQEEPWDW